MEICCSFESLVVDNCGYNPKDRKRDRRIVPLLSCDKEIAGNLAHFSFTMCSPMLIHGQYGHFIAQDLVLDGLEGEILSAEYQKIFPGIKRRSFIKQTRVRERGFSVNFPRNRAILFRLVQVIIVLACDGV